jgi:hypothetical protein
LVILDFLRVFDFAGAPEEIRTPAPQIRSLVFSKFQKWKLASYRSFPVADDPGKNAPCDARLRHNIIFFRCSE